MNKIITMGDAIREGKAQHAECPGAGSEEELIHYEVVKWLWDQFQKEVKEGFTTEEIANFMKAITK